MPREENRNPVNGYCVQINVINNEAQEDLSHKSFYIKNISRGGFCFIADIELEIDDRIKVLLRFPDEHAQEVLGRICYCNDLDNGDGYAYGFSVLDGFYSLKPGRSVS